MWVVRHNDQPLPDDHANPNYRTVKVFVGLFVRPIFRCTSLNTISIVRLLVAQDLPPNGGAT